MGLAMKNLEYLSGKGYLTPRSAILDIGSQCLYHATPEAIRANQVVIDLLQRIGAQHDATPAQIALAWLLAQKPWIAPIPGTRKLHRLDENLGAVDIQLTADDLSEIRDAMSQITVVGHRY